MSGGRRGVALVAAIGVAAMMPGAAEAANRKAIGKTSQGKQALVWVRSDGSVSYVRIRFVADCRKKDRVYTDGIFYRDRAPALFTRDGANFSDGGTFKRKLGRDTTTISTRMTGAPSADGGFEGTFRASIRIYNSKKRLRDVCRVSGVTWKVPPAA